MNGLKGSVEGKRVWRDLIVDILRALITFPVYELAGKKRVRILLYHKVCDLPPGKYQNHAVPPAMFTRQMEFLSGHKYHVITLGQFVEYKQKNIPPPAKSVVITFDDGYMENYLNAFPILQKYNFKATFFVVTDYIDSQMRFQWLDWDEPLLSQFQVKKENWLPLSRQMLLTLSAAGCEIGSHSKSHPELSQVEEKVITEEIRGSKERLEKILARPVISFSYPYGDLDARVKSEVKAAGYKAAVATGGNGSTLESDFWALGRVALERCDSFLRFRNKLRGAYDRKV